MAPSLDVLSSGDSLVSDPNLSFHGRDDYYSQGLRNRFKIDGLRVAESFSAPQERSADIGYEVDEVKYRRRSEARLRAGGLSTTVPTGWPAEVSGPLVWSGDDFSDETEYVYELSDADKEEIVGALNYFKGKYSSINS